MAIAARQRGRAPQRIDDRLFDAIRAGLEERVEAGIGEDGWQSNEVGVVGDGVGRGERQGDIAAAVSVDGTGARRSRSRTHGQAFKLPRIKSRIHSDDHDDRALLRLHSGGMSAALRQYPANGFASKCKHRQPAEVSEHQSTDGDRLPRDRYHARSRAYATLQIEARHAAPGAYRAAGYVGARRIKRLQIVFAGNSQRLDIVQVTVVAFEHKWIHCRPFAPDLRVGTDRCANLRFSDHPHAERIRQRNRRLQHAKCFNLHETDALAKAVDHAHRSRHLAAIRIARMRMNDRDASLNRAVIQCAMADRQARYIGDSPKRPGRQHSNSGLKGQMRVAHGRSSFGSSASRKPSPSRLNASTVTKMARLGNNAICGAVTMSARASLSIAPHSGVGGCAPRPRNDRLAAVMIEVPMRIVKYTTTDDMVPGRICRMIIVQSDAPMLRAASIYVSCLSISVLPRTSRANAGMLKMDTAQITLTMPLPRIATTPIASRMPGNANRTSATRMVMRSHQPS